MSNEFVALRARAREKRDKAIDHARKEYEATLVQIAAIEQDLLGKESSRHKMISTCVDRVIPRGGPFTVTDVMAGLEAMDPGRAWRRRSVDNYISRLRQRGIVRRLSKAHGIEGAQYVLAGLEVEERPFRDMPLRDVIKVVLTKPMTGTELTMAILAAGYHSTQSRHGLRQHVLVELRKGGFTKSGEKWAGA
jgi:hypothetical protein